MSALARTRPRPESPFTRFISVPYAAVEPEGNTPASTQDDARRLQAAPASTAFLVFADMEGTQHAVTLPERGARVAIGRRSALDVPLSWDPEVSRLHAELIHVGGEWTLVDDGLSANGSFVNGERLHGRRRLRDGDALRFGNTHVLFRQPRATETPVTTPGRGPVAHVGLSQMQRHILIALCRPFKDDATFATPATNEQIAGEVFLSVDAVKKHLRVLFARFDVAHLPQNEKRVRLAERALTSGIIRPTEL